MSIDDKIIFRIYRPTKTVNQSGLGNTRFWHLRTELDPYYVKPLVESDGLKNTKKHIVLKFSSLEKAVFYSKKRNAKYIIEMQKDIKRRPKSYTSNFISK